MIDDLKDRLDVWFRAHLQGIRSTVIVFGVVIGCALLSYFVTKCLSPYPSLPSAPPTIAPTITATNAPATHIPTRTITPTWTSTIAPTATTSRISTLTRTVIPTLEPSPTSTPEPSQPTTIPVTIPAGRNLLTPPPLPNTGASEQEIAEMTATATATVTPKPTWSLPAFECGIGGSIESLEWRDNVYTVTLKCPNLKWKGQRIQD